MSIFSSIASTVAGSLFGGSGGGSTTTQNVTINRAKPDTPAEKVRKLRESVKELGGYKGKKSLVEKRRRDKRAREESKPLTSADNARKAYLKLFEEALRTAAGTKSGVARSSAISDIAKPRV
jgi:hypothetical protein|tara:strand:+ start:2015 stop:2380 length:366 start_codon:yes stop_codon:yes gene_type:complete